VKSRLKDPLLFFYIIFLQQFLFQCHFELPNKKATGVNGTTKEQYSENLEEYIVEMSLKTN
jgi:hypothetical protein